MVAFIIIFIFFVLYTTACIMDGPDIKPLWMKYVSTKYRYVSIDWYRRKDDHERYSLFFSKIGRWRATDNIGELHDEVFILPSISFWYNSTAIGVSAYWLVFEVRFYTKAYYKYEAF